jgi:WD40 repeat protein
MDWHKAESLRCYSLDGSLLASASFDKPLKLWNPANGKMICSYTVGWAIWGIAFHPSKPNFVICALASVTLALLDLKVKT